MTLGWKQPTSEKDFFNMNGFAETDLSARSHAPLHTGPPTKGELLVHYPPKFTWHQLKTFVNSGCAYLDVVSVM